MLNRNKREDPNRMPIILANRSFTLKARQGSRYWKPSEPAAKRRPRRSQLRH